MKRKWLTGGLMACLLCWLLASQYAQNRRHQVTSPVFAGEIQLLETRSATFDPNKHWLAFFHIQKTSGTNWDKNYMINQLMIRDNDGNWRRACENRLTNVKSGHGKAEISMRGNFCRRPSNHTVSWYLSWHEQNFGWRCGLHPGLSDMKSCLAFQYRKEKPKDMSIDEFNSKFHYFTILRDPVKRFLSEFKHTRLDNTMWIHEMPPASKDQICSNDFYRKCARNGTKKWSMVSLSEFMSCPYSVAFNRQTRMLAEYDSQFTLCHLLEDTSFGKSVKYDRELLLRAIRALNSLSFFGIAERQTESKKLFVKMFNNKFYFSDKVKSNRRYNLRKIKLGSEFEFDKLNATIEAKIKELNHLDVDLYDYARELFESRLQYHGIG